MCLLYKASRFLVRSRKLELGGNMENSKQSREVGWLVCKHFMGSMESIDIRRIASRCH